MKQLLMSRALVFSPPLSIVCAMLNSTHWIVKTIFQKTKWKKVQVLLLLHLHLTMMMNNWTIEKEAMTARHGMLENCSLAFPRNSIIHLNSKDETERARWKVIFPTFFTRLFLHLSRHCAIFLIISSLSREHWIKYIKWANRARRQWAAPAYFMLRGPLQTHFPAFKRAFRTISLLFVALKRSHCSAHHDDDGDYDE